MDRHAPPLSLVPANSPPSFLPRISSHSAIATSQSLILHQGEEPLRRSDSQHISLYLPTIWFITPVRNCFMLLFPAAADLRSATALCQSIRTRASSATRSS